MLYFCHFFLCNILHSGAFGQEPADESVVVFVRAPLITAVRMGIEDAHPFLLSVVPRGLHVLGIHEFAAIVKRRADEQPPVQASAYTGFYDIQLFANFCLPSGRDLADQGEAGHAVIHRKQGLGLCLLGTDYSVSLPVPKLATVVCGLGTFGYPPADSTLMGRYPGVSLFALDMPQSLGGQVLDGEAIVIQIALVDIAVQRLGAQGGAEARPAMPVEMHDEGVRGPFVPLEHVCHEHELLAVAADLFRRPLGGSVLIGTVLGKIRIVSQSFSQVGLQMPDGSSFLLAIDGPFTASQDFSDFADSRFFLQQLLDSEPLLMLQIWSFPCPSPIIAGVHACSP